jgi:hypothetical protein
MQQLAARASARDLDGSERRGSPYRSVAHSTSLDTPTLAGALRPMAARSIFLSRRRSQSCEIPGSKSRFRLVDLHFRYGIWYNAVLGIDTPCFPQHPIGTFA